MELILRGMAISPVLVRRLCLQGNSCQAHPPGDPCRATRIRGADGETILRQTETFWTTCQFPTTYLRPPACRNSAPDSSRANAVDFCAPPLTQAFSYGQLWCSRTHRERFGDAAD